MRHFIVLPTYNEADNIQPLIERIFHYVPDCDILVADDDSPDGTWKIVQELSKKNPRVHLLHRKTNRGRGLAGIEGFRYAVDHGADSVMEMDADFSHDPKYLPDFFHAIQKYDVVSGSRYIQGGDDGKRSWWRKMITYFANLYIRLFLGFNLTDCSSGFRCYRREVLQSIGLDNLISTGPSIVQEILFRSCQLNFKILEIPYTFQDRSLGESKLTYRHLFKGFAMVLRLRFSRRPFKPAILPEPAPEKVKV